MAPCELPLQRGRPLGLLDLLDEFFAGLDLVQDLLAIIPVVSQGGVNFSRGQLRVTFDDFLNGQAVQLMKDVNVLDPDAAPDDAGLPPANLGIFGDKISQATFWMS